MGRVLNLRNYVDGMIESIKRRKETRRILIDLKRAGSFDPDLPSYREVQGMELLQDQDTSKMSILIDLRTRINEILTKGDGV